MKKIVKQLEGLEGKKKKKKKATQSFLDQDGENTKPVKQKIKLHYKRPKGSPLKSKKSLILKTQIKTQMAKKLKLAAAKKLRKEAKQILRKKAISKSKPGKENKPSVGKKRKRANTFEEHSSDVTRDVEPKKLKKKRYSPGPKISVEYRDIVPCKVIISTVYSGAKLL